MRNAKGRGFLVPKCHQRQSFPGSKGSGIDLGSGSSPPSGPFGPRRSYPRTVSPESSAENAPGANRSPTLWRFRLSWVLGVHWGANATASGIWTSELRRAPREEADRSKTVNRRGSRTFRPPVWPHRWPASLCSHRKPCHRPFRRQGCGNAHARRAPHRAPLVTYPSRYLTPSYPAETQWG